MNNPRQTEQLLSAILEHSSVSMQLVTFFSPNDNADSFTTMYRRILESTDEDLVFSLLTKVKSLYHRRTFLCLVCFCRFVLMIIKCKILVRLFLCSLSYKSGSRHQTAISWRDQL